MVTFLTDRKSLKKENNSKETSTCHGIVFMLAQRSGIFSLCSKIIIRNLAVHHPLALFVKIFPPEHIEAHEIIHQTTGQN